MSSLVLLGSAVSELTAIHLSFESPTPDNSPRIFYLNFRAKTKPNTWYFMDLSLPPGRPENRLNPPTLAKEAVGRRSHWWL